MFNPWHKNRSGTMDRRCDLVTDANVSSSHRAWLRHRSLVVESIVNCLFDGRKHRLNLLPSASYPMTLKTENGNANRISRLVIFTASMKF